MEKPLLNRLERCILMGFYNRSKGKSNFWLWLHKPLFIIQYEQAKAKKYNKLKNQKEMVTIAQQLNVKEFPFIINDKDGNEIYLEKSNGYWYKREYKDGREIYLEDSNGYWYKKEYKDGNVIYLEDINGIIEDNRTTEMTIAEIEKKLNITNLKIKK